jgi:polyisoprenyl-teichoic acid--peptidoglycan teichoic acid transferase
MWAKLLIAFGAIVMVVGLGGYAIQGYVLAKVNSSLGQTDLLGSDVAKGNSIKGAINILLVGLDTRPDNTIGSRSDSIIIAHVPADHSGVFMVSIPRDTNAYIPPDPATGWSGGDLKINAAFDEGSMRKGGLKGGFQLLAATIKRDYGISFNGGGIVDFGGFSDLVKKLGGVRMYVDEKTTSIHHGYLISNPSVIAKPYVLDPNCGCPKYGFNHPIAGTKPVVYTVGYHNLSAYEALDYVRIRDGLVGTDYARQRHQQQFLKALIQEMYSKGLTSPTKLTGFLSSLGKAINFDYGGVSQANWIFTLKGLSPSSVVTIKTNDGNYDHYTGPSTDDRQQLDKTSLLMLHDVITDQMAQFVASYPSWVVTS